MLIYDLLISLRPSSGAGASMAFEDAEALALLLEHHLKRDSKNGYIVAFERFTSLRRPRLVQVHKKAQETASMKQDMNVLEEMFMYLIIWAMCESAVPFPSINTNQLDDGLIMSYSIFPHK